MSRRAGSGPPRVDEPGAEGEAALPFVGREPGPRFRRTRVVIAPGRSRLYDPAEWRDAVVVVLAGDLHLECRRGGRRRFAPGSVLCLDGLALRALHNTGDVPVVLLAVGRLAVSRRAGGPSRTPGSPRPP
jgi:quercetin dioxygenase-like cupin family protein